MCEYCNATYYVEVQQLAKPLLAPLTHIEEIRQELINITGINYLRIKAKYCPMCRKEAGRVKFETKKKLRQDIEKLEKEKKQLIEKRETNYDLYKAIIAIMLQENRKYIAIDFRDVLAADDYKLAFYDNPLKTTKEIKLIRRTSNDNK